MPRRPDYRVNGVSAKFAYGGVDSLLDWLAMNEVSRDRLQRLEKLGAGNRQVLDYWQSLRTGAGLPQRASFSPAQVKSSLSKLMMVQVWPGERVICRLCGTDIVRAVGRNLTGLDIIEQTPVAFRPERLLRYSNCFEGFVHRSVRNVPSDAGDLMRAELLILPFDDLREDGSRLALVSVGFAFAPDSRLRSSTDAFVVPEFAEYLAI